MKEKILKLIDEEINEAIETKNASNFNDNQIVIECLQGLKTKVSQIDCQVIKPTLTILEIELLENLIRDNRDEGTYYGNKKYYYKRLDTIEKKLNKMREAL